MLMKPLLTIIALLGLAFLAVLLALPFFAKAKIHNGPGIYGNLRWIQLAKDEWLADGNTNEWPTAKDLFSSSPGRTFSDIIRPRYGELYFINRTGAPPFAYIPKAVGHYRGGEILVLRSNGLMEVRQ